MRTRENDTQGLSLAALKEEETEELFQQCIWKHSQKQIFHCKTSMESETHFKKLTTYWNNILKYASADTGRKNSHLKFLGPEVKCYDDYTRSECTSTKCSLCLYDSYLFENIGS